MNKNLHYYLAFSHFLGIGPARFDQLVKIFGSPKAAYEASSRALHNALGHELADKLILFRKEFDADRIIQKYEGQEVKIITREDPIYPQQYLQLSDPPICLYVKGEVNLYDFSSDRFFAIVGTRKPTPYGQQVAFKFAKELGQHGFVVVSGMAMGIDTVAHQAALAAGVRTIAILGCGVDIVYPSINQKLYHEIIASGGLILSEFPLGHEARPGQFIARNRLIAGLSRGVMVAEGAEDSGSLVTARFAAEQGKDVFAPPSPITSILSMAPNILLKEGAKLVTQVEDILEEYNIHKTTFEAKAILSNLSPVEKIIYELLLTGQKRVDEISQEAEIAVDKILSILSILEIKGVIEKNFEGKFQIKI